MNEIMHSLYPLPACYAFFVQKLINCSHKIVDHQGFDVIFGWIPHMVKISNSKNFYIENISNNQQKSSVKFHPNSIFNSHAIHTDL